MSSIGTDYPKNHGISSKSILEFLDRIETQNLEVISFILLRNGKNIAEFWRKPYRKECRQVLFSLTKSFTSIAVGIAWDNGYLDLNDRVISFFPDKIPDTITPNLEKMTVHHLISMNTGHLEHNYFKIYPQKDWIKAFLAIPPECEPGTHYCYSTHASHILAAIVEKTTGRNLVDFLISRLFGPLGIASPSWETGPDEITAGGMGLSIPTEGIAKFGQMLLDNGMYDGHRIVSEEYIKLATTKHSVIDKNPQPTGLKQGYGYHFELYRGGCFGHQGSFGQLCFVSPSDNIVIAVTSRKQNFSEIAELIYTYILGRPNEKQPLVVNDYHSLREYLVNMSAPTPKKRPIPQGIPCLREISYQMDQNPDNLERLSLSLTENLLKCEFIYGEEESKYLTFNFDELVSARDIFVKDLSLHEQEVKLYACWRNKETLELTMFYLETPYVATNLISFIEDGIMLSFKINVSLGKFSPLARNNYQTHGKVIK